MNKPKLFLFHHAGGSCYSFSFASALQQDFDIIPLELPGRGKRSRERLLRNFDLAAEDLYGQISRNMSSFEFLVYGHSMGSYLALRVVNMLEERRKSPVCLFVSGNPGPCVRNHRQRHLLEQEDFLNVVKEMRGLPSELLENPELMDFYLPILRADFEISEVNSMDNEPPIMAPLYAMMGNQEDDVDKIENWSKFTKSGFRYKIFDGDHFFIHEHSQEIAAIIRERYYSIKIKNCSYE